MGWIFTACVIIYIAFWFYKAHANEVKTKNLRAMLTELLIGRVEAHVNNQAFPVSDDTIINIACNYAIAHSNFINDKGRLARVAEYKNDLTNVLQQMKASRNNDLSLFLLKYDIFFPLEERFYSETKSIYAKKLGI